ncbi:phage portal protein [Teichococcus deserti]|uniref:phage portal protein n=1 Tax=Teichococcus deserti TaxID=1817963 RepID=UPI0009F9E2C0|nr:phage portal protein [Pseudoroseomonas deserti]
MLNNQHYEHLTYSFSEEYAGNEYIPLSMRRPSTPSNLCRVVVDDSVGFLFADNHFPTIQGKDAAATAVMAAIVRDTNLQERMIDAATRGAVGSVALHLRVIENQLLIDVLPTTHLTPEWDAFRRNPKKVTEKMKVEPQELIALGYDVDPKRGRHWFMRVWDANEETWYLPWPVSDEKAKPVRDDNRSVVHALGFCPIHWIKNLPGGDDFEGPCTFEAMISTVIEYDYLYSQGGRALRYAADPKLILKTDSTTPAVIGGAANALELSKDSDAKYLELDGSAQSTMLEWLRELRNLALESTHGFRASSDKMTMPQSGKAMELLYKATISLASRMRISYGQCGILSLMQMIARAAERTPKGILVDNKYLNKIDVDGLHLNWPNWFEATAADTAQMAQAIHILTTGRVLSRETAINNLAPIFDIADTSEELKRIEKDPQPEAGSATAEPKTPAI